jgi:hypothetical protein
MFDSGTFSDSVDGRGVVAGSMGRPARGAEGVVTWPGPRPGRPSGLPLPAVGFAPDDSATVVCAVSPLGAKGRISDAFCLRELGWAPGTAIKVLAAVGVVTVTRETADGRGSRDGGRRQSVDPSGHLRLLTLTRQIAGFRTGERLLLLADPDRQVLRITSTAVLHRLMVAPVVGSGLAAAS